MPSDEELMASYKAGDRAAFEQIFQRYAPLLLRVMQHQLSRREDAQDLVQQTFLQLHRSRADFRQDARLRPWLLTIAMNLKRRYMRRLGRHMEKLNEGHVLESVRLEAFHSDPLEVGQQVRIALAVLSPEQREVIVLHWLEGLPFSEVATVVGASLSAVKVRAHRGYVAIRSCLAREQSRERDREPARTQSHEMRRTPSVPPAGMRG
jgi:RNA polymerase sigma factor (sigma-70 family)